MLSEFSGLYMGHFSVPPTSRQLVTVISHDAWYSCETSNTNELQQSRE